MKREPRGKFYAEESKTAPVKDSFKLIAENLRDFKASGKDRVVLGDIGCAAGLLPHYLSTQYKDFEITGYEYSDELRSVAENTYPSIMFKKLDVRDSEQLPAKSLDIITMSGVLGIFDDYENIINNLLTWIKPGGRILIFNMFNPYDLDVFIKYKHSNEPYGIDLGVGWNIVSQKTIREILKKNNIDDFEFIKFNISVDLEKNQSDHVRSWTEKDAAGERYIINGLNIKQPQYLLKINC